MRLLAETPNSGFGISLCGNPVGNGEESHENGESIRNRRQAFFQVNSEHVSGK